MRLTTIILFFIYSILFSTSIFSAPVDLFETITYEDELELKKAIKSGGNVNQSSSDQDMTILMAAVKTMKPNLVKLLLDSKANPNGKSPDSGKTPLMYFMTVYYMDSTNDSDGNKIYSENQDGLTIFQMLLKAGAKATDKDKEGKSVLTYLLDNGGANQSEAIIQALLSAKADPNQKFSNDIPKSICFIAIEDTSGYYQLALKMFLKQKLCDPNKEYTTGNAYRTTPLYIAINKKEKELVDALLAAGANPNKGASDSMMDYFPIFAAINDIEMLTSLLKYKANPNSIENEIHILEHAARMVMDDETGERIINILLTNGSNINHPKLFDSYSTENKAVYAAQIISHNRIEKFLKKKGALKSTELKTKK